MEITQKHNLIMMSLFNKEDNNTNQDHLNSNMNQNLIPDNNLNENNFIFANIIFGFKDIPYNTIGLLVNNTPNNSMDLVYRVNDSNQTKNIPLTSIRNISYTDKIRTSTTNPALKENETKSILLSAIMFGGNPLLQLAGNSGFNSLFDSASNNHEKIKFNVEYEITVELTINNEEKKIVLISDNSPEKFIKQILDTKKDMNFNS